MTRAAVPSPDPTHVDADLAEELAWHLDHLAADLHRRGLSPDAAHAEARRRFGDPALITRRCRSIILKEHTMLRRLHLALTITLAALLIVSISMGVAAAARAKDEAVRARMMEAEARMHAEQALDAERKVREQMQNQLAPAKPK